jgi:serine/threonine-protein kinase HipA
VIPVKKLDVSIEINGRQREVGVISGSNDYDASFCYSEHYLDSRTARPISISLPLTDEPYGPEPTRRFFEGLLPEGFMRRTVAEQNRTDDGDYLSILEMLGAECLGAVQIKGENYKNIEPSYRAFDPETMYKLAAEGATRSADLVVEAHLSLTGASGKIGAYKSSDGLWFLPVGSAPSTHILKQSHIRYDKIVQNEQLALRTAEMLGIEVPRSEIVEAHPEPVHDTGLNPPVTENVLFATERYDRTFEGAEDYANEVMTRFANPYIEHKCMAIALNSFEKFKVRVLPSIIEYKNITGVYPKNLMFSLSQLIKFYKEGTPNDDPAVIEYIKNTDDEQIIKDLL